VEVKVLRINENRPALGVGGMPTLMLAAAMAGCFGETGIDPDLEAQRRELSRQTIETGGFEREDLMAEVQVELDDADSGMEEEPMVPPPDPDPQAGDPPPVPSHSDDSVRCGNGVLDNDEICEISLPDGEPGACPSKCSDDPCNPEKMEARGCWSVCVPLAPEPGADCG
jgi:hypothetical protein